MCTLSEPRPRDVFVNIACGSGTLMVERLALGRARVVAGYDVDERALACAEANLEAIGYGSGAVVSLEECDATALPLDSASVDTVVADLPYAMLLGSGAANADLYPALVDEAARVLKRAGRLLVVTTQNRLMDSVCEGCSERLRVVEQIPFEVPHERGVISPSIWSLERL